MSFFHKRLRPTLMGYSSLKAIIEIAMVIVYSIFLSLLQFLV